MSRLRTTVSTSAACCLTLLALLCACGDPAPPSGQDAAGDGEPSTGAGAGGAPAAPAVPPPIFVDAIGESGITAENHSGKPRQKDWIVSGMGGGCMVLDYDEDGDMDLVIVDGTMLTEEGVLEYDPDWRTRLYRNEGDLKFTDVTLEAGIDIQSFGFGGAAVDYDADGDTDFYVCTWGRNYLMQNQGDGTFTDVTGEAGLLGLETDMSTACAWGDLDGDGWLDVYVSNYIDQWSQIRQFIHPENPKNKRKPRTCEWRTLKVYCGPPGLPAQLDRLYLSNGDGTFREVTETNLTNQHELRYAFTCMMTDVDNDGDLDIYVANDTQENSLWLNDGTGVMTDRGVEAGVAATMDANTQAGMGVDAADLNRDGWLDIAVTNFSHDYNTIYINRTKRADRPVFDDSTHHVNGAKLSYHRLSWGMKLFDYDFDGDLDMFVACGHVYGDIDQFAERTGSTFRQQCLMLRNEGPPFFRFEDVTDESGPALQVRRVWRGAIFCDWDDDGDTDIFCTSLNGKPGLFRNDGGNRNAFLRFRLVGLPPQTTPAGARVAVTMPDGTVLIQELHYGSAFCSSIDPRLAFGLGAATVVPKVEVRWPGGQVQTFTDVPTRRMFRVVQGEDVLHPDEPTER